MKKLAAVLTDNGGFRAMNLMPDTESSRGHFAQHPRKPPNGPSPESEDIFHGGSFFANRSQMMPALPLDKKLRHVHRRLRRDRRAVKTQTIACVIDNPPRERGEFRDGPH